MGSTQRCGWSKQVSPRWLPPDTRALSKQGWQDSIEVHLQMIIPMHNVDTHTLVGTLCVYRHLGVLHEIHAGPGGMCHDHD